MARPIQQPPPRVARSCFAFPAPPCDTSAGERIVHEREGLEMEASKLDVLAPVEYLVVEFLADEAGPRGAMSAD